MKNYILANPLLVEVLTTAEEEELKALTNKKDLTALEIIKLNILNDKKAKKEEDQADAASKQGGEDSKEKKPTTPPEQEDQAGAEEEEQETDWSDIIYRIQQKIEEFFLERKIDNFEDYTIANFISDLVAEKTLNVPGENVLVGIKTALEKAFGEPVNLDQPLEDFLDKEDKLYVLLEVAITYAAKTFGTGAKKLSKGELAAMESDTVKAVKAVAAAAAASFWIWRSSVARGELKSGASYLIRSLRTGFPTKALKGGQFADMSPDDIADIVVRFKGKARKQGLNRYLEMAIIRYETGGNQILPLRRLSGGLFRGGYTIEIFKALYNLSLSSYIKKGNNASIIEKFLRAIPMRILSPIDGMDVEKALNIERKKLLSIVGSNLTREEFKNMLENPEVADKKIEEYLKDIRDQKDTLSTKRNNLIADLKETDPRKKEQKSVIQKQINNIDKMKEDLTAKEVAIEQSFDNIKAREKEINAEAAARISTEVEKITYELEEIVNDAQKNDLPDEAPKLTPDQIEQTKAGKAPKGVPYADELNQVIVQSGETGDIRFSEPGTKPDFNSPSNYRNNQGSKWFENELRRLRAIADGDFPGGAKGKEEALKDLLALGDDIEKKPDTFKNYKALSQSQEDAIGNILGVKATELAGRPKIKRLDSPETKLFKRIFKEQKEGDSQISAEQIQQIYDEVYKISLELDKQAIQKARESLEKAKQKADELFGGMTSGDAPATVPDDQYQTPVSERKYTVSRQDLIDVITEHLQDQFALVEVDKDQLINYITEEAYKAINRKK